MATCLDRAAMSHIYGRSYVDEPLEQTQRKRNENSLSLFSVKRDFKPPDGAQIAHTFFVASLSDCLLAMPFHTKTEHPQIIALYTKTHFEMCYSGI